MPFTNMGIVQHTSTHVETNTLAIQYKSDNYVQSRKVLDDSNTAQGQLHNLMCVCLCVCIFIVCNCCYMYSPMGHLAFG
jgi:hypothetical protein